MKHVQKIQNLLIWKGSNNLLSIVNILQDMGALWVTFHLSSWTCTVFIRTNAGSCNCFSHCVVSLDMHISDPSLWSLNFFWQWPSREPGLAHQQAKCAACSWFHTPSKPAPNQVSLPSWGVYSVHRSWRRCMCALLEELKIQFSCSLQELLPKIMREEALTYPSHQHPARNNILLQGLQSMTSNWNS